MLCRCKSFIMKAYLEIKRLIRCNKWIAITALVCTVIGIILALSKAESLVAKYSDGNCIMQITAKTFNVFSFYLKSLLFVTCIAIVGFLLTINFYCFLLNFVFIIFYVKYFLGYMLVSCILDGFTGYLLLFLVWLPLMLFNLLLLTILLIRFYELINYSCSYRKGWRIIPYKSYWRGTKNILSRHLIIVNVVTFTYLSIIIIILSLIF